MLRGRPKGLQMRLLGVVAIGLCIASCGKPSEQEDLFAKGEALYLDQHYDDAIAAFKKYLLDHPDQAGAHFYLGTCYMGSKDNRWLGIAQGELQTAIALFERQGKVSPIPRFNATYFELIGHINLAKIYLNLVFTIIENMPQNMAHIDKRQAIALTLDKCEEQYEIVKKIKPDHPDVKWLRNQIDTLRKTLSIPRAEKTEPDSVHA